MLSSFGFVLLFILAGLVLFLLMMTVARIIRKNKPTDEKLTPYESGESPEGNAGVRFNNRYYIVALVFLLFEVELLFLFPWATVFGDEKMFKETNGLWGIMSLVDVFIFVFILAIGLAYVWKRGYIDWVKPNQKVSSFESKIPMDMYETINKKYGKITEEL